jgi:hypothetical protein
MNNGYIFEARIGGTLILIKELPDHGEVKRFSAYHSANYKCEGYTSDYYKKGACNETNR